jgi:hypothetical protein
MIISYICGGLGNQMFQYAAGRRLAEKRGTEFKLDLRDYRSGTDSKREGLEACARPVRLFDLNVTAGVATEPELYALRDRFDHRTVKDRVVRQVRRRLLTDWLWPESHHRESRYVFDPAVLDLPDGTYLDGFWQSWKYFDDAAAVIRREFSFKDPSVMSFARQYVGGLRCDGEPVASVHVRRGDLARAVEQLGKPQAVHGSPVGVQYLRTAMSKFPRGTRFLVFSDTAADIAWCRANLVFDEIGPDRLYFAEGNTDLQDMALMSVCDHNVIANSTFSWWAAWLNTTPGRRVISPAVWTQKTGPMAMVVDTLIPPDWELI